MQSLALAFAASMPAAAATAAAIESCASSESSAAAARVAGGHRDLLGAQQHLGAHVLDGLEAADRLAELLAHLRVLGGGVAVSSGPARRPRRPAPSRRGPRPAASRRAAPRRVRSPAAPAPAAGRSRWRSAVRRSRRRPWRRPALIRPRRAAAAPRRGSAPSTYSARAGRPAAVVRAGRPISGDARGALARHQRFEQLGVRLTDDQRGQRGGGDGTRHHRRGGLVDHRAQIVDGAARAADAPREARRRRFLVRPRPAYGARHASGSPCSTSRAACDGSRAGGPATDQLTRGKLLVSDGR